jgi:hypothetical protein
MFKDLAFILGMYGCALVSGGMTDTAMVGALIVGLLTHIAIVLRDIARNIK